MSSPRALVLALPLLLSGCMTRVVPEFDPDRPIPLAEIIEVRQRETQGIRDMPLSGDSVAQALPLNITLRAAEVRWAHLVGALSVHDVRSGEAANTISPRLYLVDPIGVQSLRSRASLEDAERSFVEQMDSTGVGQNEVFLVCVHKSDPARACFEPGERYELQVRPATASLARTAGTSRYPFIVERRDWLLSLGVGLFLITTFLILSVG